MNGLKNFFPAHQTEDSIETPNKNNSITTFDILNLRKYYVEMETQRYPRDDISINYTENDYRDQYRVLK